MMRRRGQTLVEKIVQRHVVVDETAVGRSAVVVRSGDFVTVRPHVCLTHDNTAAVASKFARIGASRVRHPTQLVFAIDHDVQSTAESTRRTHAAIESLAHQHAVDFYPPRRGIGHQVMVEEAYAFPLSLAVASDSHANMYGGIGALGTPIVRTDAAAVWATGTTWWQVPAVVRCLLNGTLPTALSGKDVVVALNALFRNDDVLNCAVEFGGDGLRSLSIDDRLTIANMSTEWGALAGLFPVDDKTIAWLTKRIETVSSRAYRDAWHTTYNTVPSTLSAASQTPFHHPRLNIERVRSLIANPLHADPDAYYAKTLSLSLSSLKESYVSGPNSVKIASPIHLLEQRSVAIHKAYLLSCTNSRASDIKAAADVIRQASVKKVHENVGFYVAAASSHVQAEAEASGDWQVLLDAGAKPLPAGCGPCIGLGEGLLEDGEVGISATNRNFKGRMGSRNAETYLASPAVVAASALAGKIVGPASILGNPSEKQLTDPETSVTIHPSPPSEPDPSKHHDHSEEPDLTVSGFPPTYEGELLWCPTDNLNTDGIYPGKYTYQHDLTPSQMARVVMENYDPLFHSIVRNGDVLVSGKNFGCGSSREQAATALKSAGVRVILAESFSETFKRNALNNGVVCLEAPEVVEKLKERKRDGDRGSVRTGHRVVIDMVRGWLEMEGMVFRVPRLGRIGQELIAEGGLEQWIKNRL